MSGDTLNVVKGNTALILGAIIVVLLGIIGFSIFFNNGSISLPFISQTATISGKFDVNGVIPDNATITLTQKEVGSGVASQVFASGVPIGDGDSWSFNNAERGKSYEIKAEVVVNGKVVATSDNLSVSAPAGEEALRLNLTSETNNSNAVISGNIEVNGYIPQGSTITVKGKKIGANSYTTIASGLTGQARQTMSYSQATSGTIYQVQGVLLNSGGTEIGISDILSVAAPADDEKLVINSTATAPASPSTSSGSGNQAGSAVISGSINFNGAAPANSRIVIFAQAAGASSNQVIVNNVSPINGTTWSWTGANASTWYTLVAVLKQAQSNGTDQDIADSQTIQIAAPATNVIFNINSGMSLAAPGGNITVSCTTFNNGPNQNNWTATVNYTTVSGAQSYWLQIGTTSGANNTANTTQNAQSNVNTQGISAILNNNTTYYAQYAYANVPNVPINGSQYSGFSPSIPIQCGN